MTSLFFNGAARDTDNNKLHNEKTPQPTKGERYDRLKRKKIFQTSWKEKIPWVEVDNSGDLISLELNLQRHFLLYLQRLDFRRHFLLCIFGSLILTRLPEIMLMRIMK